MNFQLGRKKNFFDNIDVIIISLAIIILIPRLILFFKIPFLLLSYRVSYSVNLNDPIFAEAFVDSSILLILANLLFLKNFTLKYYLLLVAIPTVLVTLTSVWLDDTYFFEIFSFILIFSSFISQFYHKQSRFLKKKISFNKPLFILTFFSILIIIQFFVLVRWIEYIFTPDTIYGDESWKLALIDSSIYHSLASASTFLIVLFTFSFLLMANRSIIIASLKKLNLISEQDNFKKSSSIQKFSNRQNIFHYLILIGIISISILFSSLPLLESVNPTDQFFGVDSPRYVERITVPNNNFLLQIDTVFRDYNDKFLSYIFLIGFKTLTNTSEETTVKVIFMVLNPLLVITTYFFVRNNFHKPLLSLLAAFFAASSIYFVGGLYGGLLANFMAIIILFSFFLALSNYLKSQSNKQIVLLFLLLVLIQFTHVFTWSYTIFALFLFLGWSFFYNRKDKPKTKKIILLLIVILITIGVNYLKTDFAGSTSDVFPVFEREGVLAGQTFSEEEFATRFTNLIWSSNIILGGPIGNALFLLLGIFWLVNLKPGKDVHRLLASFVFIFSPIFLFGDILIQPRILYMIPFNIVACLGAYSLVDKFTDKRSSIAFLIFLGFFQINFVMRSILNFYFISP